MFPDWYIHETISNSIFIRFNVWFAIDTSTKALPRVMKDSGIRRLGIFVAFQKIKYVFTYKKSSLSLT